MSYEEEDFAKTLTDTDQVKQLKKAANAYRDIIEQITEHEPDCGVGISIRGLKKSLSRLDRKYHDLLKVKK